jgi:hypothetical protein
MMAWARVLLGLFAFLICGACLLSLLPRGNQFKDRLLELALLLPCGMVAVIFTYALFDILGLQFRVTLMTTSWLALASLAAVLRRIISRDAVSSLPPTRAPTSPPRCSAPFPPPGAPLLTATLATLLIVIDLTAFSLTLTRPVTGTDPMSIWTARAVLIQARGDLDSRELGRATFYPPLFPSSLAWLLRAEGEPDFVRIKILNPLLAVFLQLLFLRVLRPRVGTPLTLFACLLLCSHPVFFNCVREPYADLAFAAYIAIAATMTLSVATGDRRAFAIVFISAIGATLSRPEGLAAGPGLLVLASLFWPKRKERLPLCTLSLASLGALFLLVIWRFKGYQPFGSPQGFASDVGATLERVRDNSLYILGYLAERLLRFERWDSVWLLPAAILVARMHRLRHNAEARIFLWFTCWILFVHYVSYILYPGDVRQHLPLSGDRVPFRLTYLVVPMSVLLLRGIDDRTCRQSPIDSSASEARM